MTWKHLSTRRLVLRAIPIGLVAALILGSVAQAAGTSSSQAFDDFRDSFGELDARLAVRGQSLDIGPTGVRVADIALIGLNELVHTSDLIVSGVVTDVGPPIWNSISGEQFEEDPDTSDPVPGQYRIVSIDVEEVLVGNAQTRSVDVLVWWSDAVSGGDLYLDLSDGPVLAGHIVGDFNVGEERLLFVRKESVPLYGGGTVVAYVLTNSFQANFLKDGVRAVSREPLRTVESWDDLILATKGESTRGPESADSPRNALTTTDPLGAAGELLTTPDPTDVRLEFTEDGVFCRGTGCSTDAEVTVEFVEPSGVIGDAVP